MIHYGFQTDVPVTDVEEHLMKIGIKPFMDFEQDKPGMYIMSHDPLHGSMDQDLGLFETEELLQELRSRGIDV